ncbi:MAG TPA: sialidase family protein [Candidatus Deferrimicrobium sp.]|nr:sialidase family protein [Candidatus Deferrimicrobium sp.]
MDKILTTTTAAYGLGMPPGRKLLKVASGQYAGRMIAILQMASGEIKYAYADRPYMSWSTLTLIANDASDQPCDCVMDSSGNVHVAYSETATEYLVTRKLTFSGGLWSIGSKVTAYNGAASRFPSVAIESGGKLWVSWTRISGGVHYVHVKSSVDGGVTWGSGPADGGDTLTAGASSAFSKCLIGPNDVVVIYANGGLNLSVRMRPLSGGSWGTEYNIATGTGFDQHFDAAYAATGALGVVYDHGQLKYREYDGSAWAAIVTLDSAGGNFPQLVFRDAVPAVVYLSSLASDQILMNYTTRATGSFSTPAVLDTRARQFDSVLLYDASAAGFADLTGAAASATVADVYHSGSGAAIKDAGDCMYLGMVQTFRYVKFLLSTAGSGGTVVYSYWDGSNWKAFTPSGGLYSLNAVDKDLPLWDDYDGIPDDWQKKLVNGQSQFWLKIEVSSSFTTGPVGSQITAASDLQALILRR